MDVQLRGDVVAVVGAGRGIGRAIAEAFVAEEARVALVDLDPAVHETSQAINEQCGVETISLTADVTDYTAVKKAASEIAERLAPARHLVFTAGAPSSKFGYPFWNLEPTDWPRVLEVNLIGAVNAAHAFAPAMSKRRAGTMVFLASIAGQIGSQTDPPYSAAKAGLINFAQCAAKDLATYDVRVNVISPGMIKTLLNRGVWQAWYDQQAEEQRQAYDEWAAEKIHRTVPLRRWQEPQDIAAAAVFLASPLAKNITGQTINVDGGQVMHS
ncbi:MAG: SDR family NAD(P)-dependent oxidoreductase [Pirellulaceae bacterium]